MKQPRASHLNGGTSLRWGGRSVLYRHDQYIAALAGEHVGWFLHVGPRSRGRCCFGRPGSEVANGDCEAWAPSIHIEITNCAYGITYLLLLHRLARSGWYSYN
jgi:hypothetical protein